MSLDLPFDLSVLPLILGTGRCAMSTLTQLMASGTIVPTSSSQLLQTSDNQTHVIGGSFMVFTCAPGLTNIGGSLNVTCNANNAWSTPPNCVSGTGAQVTTFPTTGAMCGYSSSLLTIPNGMATNWNGLILATATQAMSGSFIDYMCTPPFVMVGSSRIVCSNGAWSAQPVCNGRSILAQNIFVRTTWFLFSSRSSRSDYDGCIYVKLFWYSIDRQWICRQRFIDSFR